MTEIELITNIAKWLGPSRSDVKVGVGDDTAVLSLGVNNWLWTVDRISEGVHFNKWFLPNEIGHKALAVSLSDIAAMGGVAKYALVSLSVPQTMSLKYLKQVYDGMLALAKRHGVQIVGGNVCRSHSGIIIDTTVLGTSSRPIKRTGARPGNLIGVVGRLGYARAGLEWIEKRGRDRSPKYRKVLNALLTPEPLLKVGQALAKVDRISSLIDVSDGLLSDLSRVALASKVDLYLDEKILSADPGLEKLSGNNRKKMTSWILNGGEDYALAFTFHPSELNKIKRQLSKMRIQFRVIGKCAKGAGNIILKGEGGIAQRVVPAGWDHFSSGTPLVVK